MSSKIQEFIDLVRVEDIDIACVSETHFSCNSRMKDLPDYHLIRGDRATHMGGLLFLVKKDIKFESCDYGPTNLIEPVK